jgi:RNA polymerase sigma factor (sigma-70 family)
MAVTAEIVRRPRGRMAFRRAPYRGPGGREPTELGGYRRVDPRRLASLSDEQLVAQVRAGEDSAFEAIYDRYARGVLAFCGHMLGSRDEAEDALQLTFVSAYQALRGGDHGISLRPWLFTIARNRCLSELRARPRAVGMDEPVVDRACLDGPGVQVQRRAELRDLVDEIKRLPAEQRAALVLFELGDHSHAEIAEVLGVGREKVKALIFQAREALVRGREARDRSCAEVRERLATVGGKIPVRSTTRAHIDRCPSCKAFEREVRRQRAALALILPVGLVGELKASVLGVVFTGGGGTVAAGAGASAGGGIVAAGAGASGSGVVLSSGAAAAGSGTAAVGGGAVGTVAAGAGAASGLTGAGAASGLTGAGAVGGLAGAGAGAGGLAVASAAPVTAVATGLTAGGTELAVAGGVAGAGSTAVVAKIVAAAAIATAVFGASHAAGPVPALTTVVSENPAIHRAPTASAASNLGAAKLPAMPSSASTSGTTTGDARPNTPNPNTPESSPATNGSSTAAGANSSTGGSTTATTGGSSTAAGTSPATSGPTTAAGANSSTGGSTSATTGGSSTAAGTSPATSASTTAAATSPTTSTTTGSARGVPEAQADQAQSDAAAPVEDAATQISDEIAFIQASPVPTGPKQTLTDKLSAAHAALGASDKKLAENDLDAALNYLDARSGKTIPKTTATQLIADITRIKAAIG